MTDLQRTRSFLGEEAEERANALLDDKARLEIERAIGRYIKREAAVDVLLDRAQMFRRDKMEAVLAKRAVSWGVAAREMGLNRANMYRALFYADNPRLSTLEKLRQWLADHGTNLTIAQLREGTTDLPPSPPLLRRKKKRPSSKSAKKRKSSKATGTRARRSTSRATRTSGTRSRKTSSSTTSSKTSSRRKRKGSTSASR